CARGDSGNNIGEYYYGLDAW
nr:immunoglobulin heavy chain junction region [Macaca mulatta]